MKPVEDKIDAKRSDYFINAPTPIIRDHFLYPIQVGHFFYLPGYRQHRLRFDSFLLLYVLEGSLTIEYGGKTMTAGKDYFLLLDCYKEHCYYTDTACEISWIHFDGYNARRMYEMAIEKLGNVFTLIDPLIIMTRMAKIYHPFRTREPVREMLLSKYLSDILTEFIIYTPLQLKSVQRASSIDSIRIYIRDHFQEELRVEDLARQALMSPYYFIRIFRQETGMSPHEYIVNYRLQVASILLQETDLSVSNICFESGFSSESVFCAAFKKKIGVTPTAYRKSGRV